jgi:hypothetical protein
LNNKINCKIAKSLEPKSRIVQYLHCHGIAGEEEIAHALHLHMFDVLGALFELEKEGVVISIPEESSLDSGNGV